MLIDCSPRRRHHVAVPQLLSCPVCAGADVQWMPLPNNLNSAHAFQCNICRHVWKADEPPDDERPQPLIGTISSVTPHRGTGSLAGEDGKIYSFRRKALVDC